MHKNSKIEEKAKELQRYYCPNVTIVYEYPTSSKGKDIVAEVDLVDMKKDKCNFPLRIYPSFYNLNSAIQEEFILRHEFMHLKDALNPTFEFDYEFLCVVYNSTPSFEAELAKSIWDISIDMRLKREGYRGGLDYNERIRDFKEGYLNKFWKEHKNKFCFDLNSVKVMVKGSKVNLHEIKRIAKKAKEIFAKKVAEEKARKYNTPS